MSKSNKVFVGTENIAGNAMMVAKALRGSGINAVSYAYNAHPFGYMCDHDGILYQHGIADPKNRKPYQKIFINKYTMNFIWSLQRFSLFFSALFKFDTFIFISHDTFFKNNSDLFFLKLFKKKIAFLFVGCPERDPTDITNTTDKGFCSFCDDVGMQKSLKCYNGNLKKKKINYLSEKADIIFTHRDTASFIADKKKIREFYCSHDKQTTLEAIQEKFNNISEINITHLPSNKLLKGTKFVENAIADLKAANIKLNYNSKRIMHSEVNAVLEKTHILVDQFGSGYGLLSVEGMAAGCVVICRSAAWFKEDFPDLPVISCEPEELSATISELIQDKNKMLEIAIRSFNYYQKYHAINVLGKYYRSSLNLN